jgi:hypothetical protein
MMDIKTEYGLDVICDRLTERRRRKRRRRKFYIK